MVLPSKHLLELSRACFKEGIPKGLAEQRHTVCAGKYLDYAAATHKAPSYGEEVAQVWQGWQLF
jgi:hypothetical protein